MEQFEEAHAIPANELKKRATRDRISWRTVERAKGRLGIRARRENLEGGHGAGRWMWAAPRLSRQGRDDESSEEPKAANETPLAALATVETEKTPNLGQPFDSDGAGKTG
jgi:hypothetical protein